MGPGVLENTSNYGDARTRTHLAEGGQPARCAGFSKPLNVGGNGGGGLVAFPST